MCGEVLGSMGRRLLTPWWVTGPWVEDCEAADLRPHGKWNLSGYGAAPFPQFLLCLYEVSYFPFFPCGNSSSFID